MPGDNTNQYPTVVTPPPEGGAELPRTITGAVSIPPDKPEPYNDILPDIVPGFKRIDDVSVPQQVTPPAPHHHAKPTPASEIIAWAVLLATVLFCTAYVLTAWRLAPGLPLPFVHRSPVTHSATPSATSVAPSQPRPHRRPRHHIYIIPASGPESQSNGTGIGPTPVPTPTAPLPSPASTGSPTPTATLPTPSPAGTPTPTATPTVTPTPTITPTTPGPTITPSDTTTAPTFIPSETPTISVSTTNPVF